MLLALLFLGFGCNGKKEKKSDKPVEAPVVDDKGIAFEVFERIPKEDLDERFRMLTYTCPDACRRHFGVSEGNDNSADLYYENGGNRAFSVDCFPMNGGGWLAMLVNEGCFDGCNQTVKTYVYKAGVLNFASDVLPRPTMEELVADPFLVYGISEEEITDFKSEWDERYLYYNRSDDTLSVSIETLNFDDLWMTALREKQYVWDGERFVPIDEEKNTAYTIVERGALGKLRLGDPMPTSVADFSQQELEEGVVFTRNGEAYFKLIPDGQGLIEAIDVFTPNYTYYRGKVGDTLNRLLYKGAAENRAFFKDGRFVVTEESEYDDNWIDYVGPFDALDGQYVEGEIADPNFRPGATVQYLHLYKHRNWESDTCDMRALREALEDAMLDQGNPTYGINHFEYYREMYNDSCQGWCDSYNYYLHCYPLKSGGFKVYETANWQTGWEEEDSDSGFSKISAYIYKNGQLTEVEPEPELNDFPLKNDNYHFSTVSGVFFYDRTMTIVTESLEDGRYQGVEFTWDGATMKKTFEGVFDN